MGLRKSEPSFVQVVCDACLASYDPDCIICRGQKFYSWDPATQCCYLADGSPILYQNKEGEIVQVRRNPSKISPPPAHVTAEVMLAFIEGWTLQDPGIRQFKLSFSEVWISSIWMQGHDKKPNIFTGFDAKECIQNCYTFLLYSSSIS